MRIEFMGVSALAIAAFANSAAVAQSAPADAAIEQTKGADTGRIQ